MNYYISINGDKYSGPFTVEHLVENGLTRDSWVWCEGLDQWCLAHEMPELNDILPHIQSTTLGGNNKRPKSLPVSSPATISVDASNKTGKKGENASVAPDKPAKTKYDFPVSTCLVQAFIIFVCVLFFLLAEVGDDENKFLVILDFFALATIVLVIIFGFIIKRLNKISFSENTKSRIWADRLCHINGIVVSVMFAVGLLIALVKWIIYASS